MSKILITGTAGFVGFHLVTRLLKENFEIVGIDNINDYYDVNLKYGRLEEAGIPTSEIEYNKEVVSKKNPAYKFVKLDIGDQANVFDLFKRESFDCVINLAAQAGVRYSLINPNAYVQSNVSGFLNILEACRNFPVKHLIYASSSSVYGANRKTPFAETDNVDNPVSLYAATKKSNELFAHTYSHLFNIPTTGLRFFTVYGPWGRPDMAYFSFTKAILAGEPIQVFNNGVMKRDFTYIDDITESILRLIGNPPSKGTELSEKSTILPPAYRLFNIGNNSPVALMDFIKTIEELTGKEANKVFLPMQPGDVPATYADITGLQSLVGPTQGINIADGLGVFVKWYREYYK